MSPNGFTPFCEPSNRAARSSRPRRPPALRPRRPTCGPRTIPTFRAAWDEAKEASADLLEKEARRRAVEGLEEPIIHKGMPTYVLELDEAGNAIYDLVQREVPNADGSVSVVNERVPRKKLDENGQPIVMTVRKPSDALLVPAERPTPTGVRHRPPGDQRAGWRTC